MVRRLVLASVAFVLACQPTKPEASPKSDDAVAKSDDAPSKSDEAPPESDESPQPTVPAPVLDPIPALRRDIVETEAAGGLEISARNLVHTVAPGDPVAVELSLRPKDKDTWGGPTMWAPVFDALEIVIVGPEATRTLPAKSVIPPQRGSLGLFGDHRFQISGGTLTEPGEHKLEFRSLDPVKLASGELTVNVAENLMPLSEVESAAAAALRKYKGLEGKPRLLHPIMEDEAGNRVLRYSIGEEYDVDFTEAILDRSGKLLSLHSTKVFTCVAEGTTIATPSGDRAVEGLEFGDEVIAWDEAEQRETVTSVVSLFPSYGERLIEIGDLRVTGRHPIFVDGDWVEARTLRAGARVQGLGGVTTQITPRKYDAPTTVYQLSVAPPHNYFADGVLVHNKATETAEAESMRTDLDYRPKPTKKK